MSQSGTFITLEGGEGAGKTTLAKALAEYFSSQGREVIVTREPGGTPNAETLRTLLVEGDTDKWSAMSETLILYAARVDHVERLIKPALERSAIVICDRFSDSTIAYQGAACGIQEEVISLIDEASLGGLKPNITLIVDLDPEIGLERTRNRGESVTRFEKQNLQFHNALRASFKRVAESDPDRCVIINGEQSADQVYKEAIKALKHRMETHCE